MGPIGPTVPGIPSTPGGPGGPGITLAAPVAPVAPVGPVGPLTPVAPVGPAIELAAPVAPVNPVAPVAPVEPAAPVGPGITLAAPVAPVGPRSPVAPVGPAEPVGPAGPLAPVGPTSPAFEHGPTAPVATSKQTGLVRVAAAPRLAMLKLPAASIANKGATPLLTTNPPPAGGVTVTSWACTAAMLSVCKMAKVSAVRRIMVMPFSNTVVERNAQEFSTRRLRMAMRTSSAPRVASQLGESVGNGSPSMNTVLPNQPRSLPLPP